MFNFGFWKRVGGLCKDYLEALYTSAITSSGLAYKDKYGEDRKYHKAGSMKFDGTAYLTESSILGTYTTTNDGTSVATISAGRIDYTAGSCWNIKVFDAGGTEVIRCPGVTGDGTTLANVLSDDGSNGLTVVNAPGDFWAEHTDGDGSNYLNIYGFNVDGTKKQPASQANSQLDWLGNPLTYQGVAGTPFEIGKAPVFVGDRVCYGESDNNISVSGNVVISVNCTPDSVIHQGPLAFYGSSQVGVTFKFRDNNKVLVIIGNSSSYVIVTLGALYSAGSVYLVEITIDQNGNISAVVNGSPTTCSIDTVPAINYVGSLILATNDNLREQFDGVIEYVSILSDDKNYHYSFTEGTPTDPSLTTYDRSGNGNHITLLNSSAANWALKERSEYPLNDGFTFDGTNLIPSLRIDKTKDATGADIQYTDKQTMNDDNPSLHALAYTPDIINWELSSGNNFFFDGAGGRNELTWADMVSNYNDIYFYESPDKLVINTEPLTGACLEKTKKYVGLTELDFIVDDNGESVTDDNSEYIYK